MRVYVDRRGLYCCGRLNEVRDLLLPLARSRATLKELLNLMLH